MKIDNNYNEAVVSSKLETHQATISLTPEVFEMLISGIYNNKERAPARELVCNARDSHVEAGVSEPIQIHLPTHLEPWFSVKDVGLGMSKEMVNHTYMCLGQSTKRHSNELIGAKGIGSKSPFAMVDGFSVVSCYNGIKTSYSIFLNKGIPDIATVSEVKTSEHNGVEVKFPIAQNLIDIFVKECENVLYYFDFPYEINFDPCKGKSLKTSPVIYQEEIDGITFQLMTSESMGYTSVVVMGGVAYNQPFSNNRDGIIAVVPIGACEVDPSRENIVKRVEDGSFYNRIQKAREDFVSNAKDFISDKVCNMSNRREIVEWVGNNYSHFSSYQAQQALYEKYRHLFETISRGYYVEQESRMVRYRAGVLSPFLNGKDTFIYADEFKLKTKAMYVLENSDYKRVFIIDSDKFRDHPLLKGEVKNSSDIILPKKERAIRPRQEWKGHKVFKVTPDNGVVEEFISKEDFANIGSVYIRNASNSGWGNQFAYRLISYGSTTNCKQILEEYNLSELVFVTQYQFDKFCKPNQLFNPKSKEIEKKYKRYKLHSRLSSYSWEMDAMKEWGELSKTVVSVPKMPKEENLPTVFKQNRILLSLAADVDKIDDEVGRIVDKFLESYSELKEKMKTKYPLLAMVGLQRHIDNPDILKYIDLINKEDRAKK